MSTNTRNTRVKTRLQNVWVVRQRPRGWAVRIGGDPEPVSVHRTQHVAIKTARILARTRRCELIIQNRCTQIRAKDSLGRDPFPPRG